MLLTRAMRFRELLFAGILAVPCGCSGGESSPSPAGGQAGVAGLIGTGGLPGSGGANSSGGAFTSAGTGNGGASKGGTANSSGGATGGASTSTKGGANGSGGATQEALCPQAPPADATPCSPNGRQCFYDACPNGARTQATCASGSWSLQTSTSCVHSCMGALSSRSCETGEICLIYSGGALLVNCVPNGCGAGPISAQCAGAPTCTVSFSVEAGATVTCNTCPQGGCP